MNRRYKVYAVLGVIVICAIFSWISRYLSIKELLLSQICDSANRNIVPLSVYASESEYYADKDMISGVLETVLPVNGYVADLMIESQSEIEEKDICMVTTDNVITVIKNKDAKTDTDTNADTNNNTNIDTNTDTADNKDSIDATADLSGIIKRNNRLGIIYERSKLNDYNYVHDNFYTVTSITSLTNDIFRPKEFLDMDMSISDDNSKPQILIFHTHSQEGFVDSTSGDLDTTIVGVGDYLTTLLTKEYGYNVIHDRSIYDYRDGILDRSEAYTYAEENVQKILDDNPSISVVIDLHRDGVPDNVHLVTEMDGKKVAKIMFFNGLSYSRINGEIDYLYNPYRDENLAMSLQMYLLGKAYYPEFLRCNYVNAYRYCLHMRGKSMLIEAGAQNNTFEEVKNAMEPLADMLDKMLRGEKAYD